MALHVHPPDPVGHSLDCPRCLIYKEALNELGAVAAGSEESLEEMRLEVAQRKMVLESDSDPSSLQERISHRIIEDLRKTIDEKNRLLEERAAELAALNNTKQKQMEYYQQVNEMVEQFKKKAKERENTIEDEFAKAKTEIARLTTIVNSQADSSHNQQCDCESLRKQLAVAKEEVARLKEKAAANNDVPSVTIDSQTAMNNEQLKYQKYKKDYDEKLDNVRKALTEQMKEKLAAQTALKTERDSKGIKFNKLLEKYRTAKTDGTKLEEICEALKKKVKILTGELEQAKQQQQSSNAVDEQHQSSSNLDAVENVIAELYNTLSDEHDQQIPKSSSGGFNTARLTALACKTKVQAECWQKVQAKLTEYGVDKSSDIGLETVLEGLKVQKSLQDVLKHENRQIIVGDVALMFASLMRDYDQLGIENERLRSALSAQLSLRPQQHRVRLSQLERRLREVAPNDPLLQNCANSDQPVESKK